jgi:broad specificity phosphatase PhoE
VAPPPATRGSILLVRHGQTSYSAAGRHTGLVDVPLDADGERQARALAPVVAAQQLAAVWSSPLLRARQTAELAGLHEPRLDARLQEWDYGGYDGLTSAQISEQRGRPWSLWKDGVVPGSTPGESLSQVRARCDDVIARVLPLVLGGERVALVAHGHQLRVLATGWLDVPPAQGALWALGPASLSVLGFEGEQRVLRAWNAGPNQRDVAGPQA